MSEYVTPMVPYIVAIGLGLATIAGTAAALSGVATAVGVVTAAVLALNTMTKKNVIVLAITAIATAALLIYKNWDGITAYFKKLWDNVGGYFEDAWKAIKTVFTDYTPAGLIYSNWDGITKYFKELWVDVKAAFSAGWKLIKAIFIDYHPAVLIYKNWDGISKWFTDMWASVKTVFVNAWKGIGDTVSQMITDIITKLKNFGADAIKAVKDGLKGLPGAMIDSAKDSVDGLTGGLADGAGAVLEGGKKLGGNILQGLKDVLDTNSPSKETQQLALYAGQGVVLGLNQSEESVYKAASDVADNILEPIETAVNSDVGLTAGRTIAIDIGDGIEIGSISAVNAMDTLTDALSDSLYDVISGTSSVKDAFKDLGDYMTDWLTKKIAEFAANKIMIMVGSEGLGAVTGGLTSLLSGGAAAGTATAGTATAGTATAGTAAASSGIMASAGPALAAIAGAAINAAVYGGISKALGGNATGAAIGSLLGPAGALIGGAFGGSTQTVGAGVEVAVNDGQLAAQQYEDTERQRSFYRGTSRNTNYSEVDGDLAAGISASLDVIKTNVVTTFSEMSGLSSDAILQGFNVDAVKLNGATFEEDLVKWVTGVTGDAYRVGLENSTPMIKLLVQDQVGSIAEATNEELVAAVDSTYKAIGVVGPAFEALGVNFGNVSDDITLSFNLFGNEIEIVTGTAYTAAENMVLLTEALGGADAAVEKMNFMMLNVAPASVAVEYQMSALVGQMSTFDTALASQGLGVIRTTEDLYKYITAQDAETIQGRANIALAMDSMQTMVQVSEIYKAQQLVLTTVSDAATQLNLNFDAMSPTAITASGALVDLMGGIEGFTAAMGNYYDKFYSEEEKAQLTKMQSVADVAAFNSTIGKSGDAAIDTAAEFRTYVEGLDLQTESGRAAYAQAMELTDSMYTFTEAGQTLNEALAAIPEGMGDTYGSMVQSSTDMLAELGKTSETFKDTATTAEEAATSLGVTIDQMGAVGVASVDMSEETVDSMTKIASGAKTMVDATTDSMGDMSKSANDMSYAGTGAFTALKSGAVSFGNVANQVAQSMGGAAANIQNAANNASNAARTVSEAAWKASEAAKNTNNIYHIDGSHYNGLANVPFDGYIAELHKDEAVLTAAQANSLRNGVSTSNSSNTPISGPAARSAGSNDSGQLARIEKILADTQRMNAEMMAESNARLGSINNNSARQVAEQKNTNKEIERSSRREATG